MVKFALSKLSHDPQPWDGIVIKSFALKGGVIRVSEMSSTVLIE